jgi:hypothetical protein
MRFAERLPFLSITRRTLIWLGFWLEAFVHNVRRVGS